MIITRRKFLKQSIIGALGLAIAPTAIMATAQKAPAAASKLYPNPLFTGALGRYEGVHIVESINAPLMEGIYSGSGGAVKYSWVKEQLKGEWIPYNKLYRPGGRQSKRRG